MWDFCHRCRCMWLAKAIGSSMISTGIKLRVLVGSFLTRSCPACFWQFGIQRGLRDPIVGAAIFYLQSS
ncbi:hypothetical protein TIFTF001_016467 [Ficus carica]|uniref:Uncharacterized protein n=1 Tax=Ficus carica TaxID=3494 RepID=A0AA88D9W5_FICCA|nr:hypothetical protein TIFTF001_016467 [Ficus carica]